MVSSDSVDWVRLMWPFFCPFFALGTILGMGASECIDAAGWRLVPVDQVTIVSLDASDIKEGAVL